MDADKPQPRRESLVTVVLAGIAALFFLGYLILITGGWFFWLVLVLFGMIAFMAIHYLLWGRMLEQQVAGEREEEELRRRAEADGE